MANNELLESYELPPIYEGFHITDNTIAHFRNALITAHWPANEAVQFASMERDREDFKTMSPQERYYIECTLVLFLISDDYVDEMIEDEMLKRIKNRIWRGYETQKKSMEDIHSETYRLLLEYLVPGRVDDIARHVREEYPFISAKIEWCRRSLSGQTRLAHCVFIMTIIELLFFSTSFATIFWYKTKDRLPGIAYANEIIARDEGSHGEFDIYIYNTLEHRLDAEEAARIMQEAVEIECTFANTITPDTLGINKELLCEYVRYIANSIMTEMHYEPLYQVAKHPLPYMMELGIRRKTDFFRKKDNSYQAYVIEQYQPGDPEYINPDDQFLMNQGN